ALSISRTDGTQLIARNGIHKALPTPRTSRHSYLSPRDLSRRPRDRTGRRLGPAGPFTYPRPESGPGGPAGGRTAAPTWSDPRVRLAEGRRRSRRRAPGLLGWPASLRPEAEAGAAVRLGGEERAKSHF